MLLWSRLQDPNRADQEKVHRFSNASLAADCVISDPTSGFGFGVRKLHKSAQDVLRHLLKDAGTLTKDDERRLAFLSTHDNSFANAFPLALTGSDP